MQRRNPDLLLAATALLLSTGGVTAAILGDGDSIGWTERAGLILTAVTSIAAVYIAYAALKFSAIPRLLLRVTEPNPPRFSIGQVAKLSIQVENVGHVYAKPAATNVRVYCNFDPQCIPRSIRYGSALQLSSHEVAMGKAGRKYLMARGLELTYHEPPESLEISVEMPERPGAYLLELLALSNEHEVGYAELVLQVDRE